MKDLHKAFPMSCSEFATIFLDCLWNDGQAQVTGPIEERRKNSYKALSYLF